MTLDEMETKVFLAMMACREVREFLNGESRYDEAGEIVTAEDVLSRIQGRLFDAKMAARSTGKIA